MSPESPLVTRGRWLRTGVFTLAMTLLATTAHLLAGGRLPAAGVTILAGLMVGCLAFPVTRRDRGLRSVVAGTVAAQAALHVAFAVSMAGFAASPAATGSTGAGHMVMPTGTSGVSVEQAWTALRLETPTPTMLAAHALAALALAVGLRRGEQALLGLAGSVRTYLGVLVAVATRRLEPFVFGSDSSTRGTFDVVQLAGTVLGHSRWGRAPPVVPAH
jgi:hypothetical protein